MRTLLLATLLLSLSACDKPSEADCQKAVENISMLRRGQPAGEESGAFVRKCRAQSSKEAVRCFIAAKTVADLDACETAKK
jgi:hypothetical protein